MIEQKKIRHKAFLERTTMLRSLGLLMSLSIVTLIINWRTYDYSDPVEIAGNQVLAEEILDIPLTEQPPPPPPSQLQVLNIVEVPDEQKIIEDVEISLDIEMSEDLVVEQVVVDIEEGMEEEEVDEVFMVVEERPNPKGGFQEFYTFVAKNLNYPSRALKMKVSGKVFLQFIVEKDGSLTNIEVVKGIGAGCDEEAIRVLGLSPNWNPGKQRGKAVKVRMIVPINFIYKER